MNQALWVAKTGLDAQQTRMAVVSNNLANVNTTGFKRDRAVFEDLIYQNVRQAGANSTEDTTLPSGLYLGTGVRTVATQKLHTQGNIVQTNNSFDIAVQGNGFFQKGDYPAHPVGLQVIELIPGLHGFHIGLPAFGTPFGKGTVFVFAQADI